MKEASVTRTAGRASIWLDKGRGGQLVDRDMLRLRAEMVRGLVAGLVLAVAAIALVFAL